MQFVLILALLVAIGAIIFAAQNGDPVTVQLFFWSFKSSLALILVITFLMGVLTSWMVSISTSILRLRRRNREGKKRLVKEPPPSVEPENPSESISQEDDEKST